MPTGRVRQTETRRRWLNTGGGQAWLSWGWPTRIFSVVGTAIILAVNGIVWGTAAIMFFWFLFRLISSTRVTAHETNHQEKHDANTDT